MSSDEESVCEWNWEPHEDRGRTVWRPVNGKPYEIFLEGRRPLYTSIFTGPKRRLVGSLWAPVKNDEEQERELVEALQRGCERHAREEEQFRRTRTPGKIGAWCGLSEGDRTEFLAWIRREGTSDEHKFAADALEAVLGLQQQLEHHRKTLQSLVHRGTPTEGHIYLLTDLAIEEILREREPWLFEGEHV